MNQLRGGRERWNERYSDGRLEKPDLSPSNWLVDQRKLLESMNAGKALDIACGYGRNALYLAELGFRVDAVDISDVAIDWLTAESMRRNVPVSATLRDLEKHSIPERSYDLIICFRYLQRSLFPAIQQALLPQGLLIFETFSRDHIDVLGYSMRPAYVLEHNELLQAFGDLGVLRYRESIQETGQGNEALSSLVAINDRA